MIEGAISEDRLVWFTANIPEAGGPVALLARALAFQGNAVEIELVGAERRAFWVARATLDEINR